MATPTLSRVTHLNLQPCISSCSSILRYLYSMLSLSSILSLLVLDFQPDALLVHTSLFIILDSQPDLYRKIRYYCFTLDVGLLEFPALLSLSLTLTISLLGSLVYCRFRPTRLHHISISLIHVHTHMTYKHRT